jgi:Family of unknown function (DUF6459)
MPEIPPEPTGQQQPELTEVPLLTTRRRTPGRPLPDATAIRVVPVPDSAPPFDDELASDSDQREQADHAVPGSRKRQPAGQAPAPARGDLAASSPPDEPWPGKFAQVLAETLAGARSPQQLTPWTTQEARRRIRQLGPLLSTGQQPRVRRLLAAAPLPGVVEMTVVVSSGQRLRAIAVRLERTTQQAPSADGSRQWICTAVEAA